MNSRSSTGSALRDAPGLLVVFGVYGVLLWASWRRTADPLVDFGREAYTAWRLSAGDLLYRDVASLFGPLAPYAEAAGMAVFGSSLGILFAVNALLIAVAAILVYLFVSRSVRGTTAILAATIFLGVCAFAHQAGPNFNFLAPYSQASVWGVVVAVGAVVCFDRWLAGVQHGERRGTWMFAAGVLVGLTLLTKPEIAVASTGAGMVAVVMGTWTRSLNREGSGRWNWKAVRWPILTAASGAALPLLLTFVGFSLAASARLGMDATLAAFRPLLAADPLGMPFYQHWTGLDQPWTHTAQMVGATAWICGSLVVMGGLDRLLLRVSGWLRRFGRIAILSVVVVALEAGGLLETLVFDTVPRSAPLLLIASLVWFVARLAGGERDDASGLFGPEESPPRPSEALTPERRTVALVIWFVFSLLLLAKLGLRPRFSHYGFYLGAPAAVALTVVLVDVLPGWIERRTGSGALVRLAGVGLVLLTLIAHVTVSLRQVRAKDVRIAGAEDVLWGQGEVAEAVDTTLEKIEQVTPPGTTLVVIPEGASLNYWTRRPSPTRHVSFMPPELAIYGSEQMRRAIERAEPDFVLLWDRPLPDYGGGRYGDTSATGAEIVAFVRDHYRCVERIPVRDRSFDFELLERRERRHAAGSSNCG